MKKFAAVLLILLNLFILAFPAFSLTDEEVKQKIIIPVYFGSNYNKVNYIHYENKDHTIVPLGSSNDETTYVDALGGRVLVNNSAFENKLLYKIQ